MTSWLISLVIYLCHSRLMMLGSHQIVQAWGDVYLSICKDYPLSTAVQRCLGCWPCKAGEHISVPYITSSVATWDVKFTAWMGLAWPHLFSYGHCVQRKFMNTRRGFHIFFIFQWSKWFSGSPSCYFWLNIKSIDELDNKFLFQQYPPSSSI